VWLTVPGVVGGLLGGVLVCGALWRPIWPVLAYLLVLPVAWLGILRLTLVFGLTIRWQAVLAFFWAFVLALPAVIGGHISNWWLSYGISLGGGLFVALPFGVTHPSCIRSADAWMLAGPAVVGGEHDGRDLCVSQRAARTVDRSGGRGRGDHGAGVDRAHDGPAREDVGRAARNRKGSGAVPSVRGVH
jgi:hypothetical protein